MNFYELKLNLNFPNMAGAIRRKVDVVALLALNEEEINEIDLAIDWMFLNHHEDGSHGYAASIERMKKLRKLHVEDVATLKAYLKEHKMTE